MPSPIIHIGYPKTATTWLQMNLFRNLPGTTYIGPPVAREHIMNEENDFNAEITKEKLMKDCRSRILISDPELSGIIRFRWKEGKYRDEIAKRLHAMFPDASILLFVRNQAEFIVSAYVYYIRKGGTYGFARFLSCLNPDNASGPLSLEYLKYNGIIELYMRYYPKEQIRVYLYENFLHEPVRLTGELISHYGFGCDVSAYDFSGKENSRLRRGLMHIMKTTNTLTKEETHLKSYIVNLPFMYHLINQKYALLNKLKIFGKPYSVSDLFDRDQFLYCTNYFKDSNRKLKELFPYLDMESFSYPL